MSVPPGDPMTSRPVQLMWPASPMRQISRTSSSEASTACRDEACCGCSMSSVLKKSDDGSITRVSIEGNDLGDLFATVVTLDPDQLFDLLDGGAAAEARELAQPLPPGAALAFLLVEHRWARPLFDAIADAGGVLLGEGFIDSAAEDLLGAEIAAFDEAAHVIGGAPGRSRGRRSGAHGR